MKNNCKILILTTSYPRTPDDEAGIFVARLIAGLNTHNILGTLLVPHDQHEPTLEQQGGICIKRFSYGVFSKGRLAFGAGIIPNLRRNPFLALQAPGLLFAFAFQALTLRQRYDILHCNWAITAIPGMIAGLLTRKPYVITIRGEDLRLLRNLFLRKVLALPFHFAAAITCVSDSTASELTEHYPGYRKKIVTVLNGVSAPEPDPDAYALFQAAHPELQDGKIAIFIGTIIPRKQVHVLVETFASKQFSDWKLLILGRLLDTTYVARIMAAVREANCSERILLKGAVSPAEIPLYLKRADVYVSASEHEGRPNSVLEALAIGTPIILSNIEAHREIVTEFKTGSLFEPGNCKALAGQLASIPDKKTPTEIRSWADSAREYLELFNQIQKK